MFIWVPNGYVGILRSDWEERGYLVGGRSGFAGVKMRQHCPRMGSCCLLIPYTLNPKL